jgi:hypothetical protein
MTAAAVVLTGSALHVSEARRAVFARDPGAVGREAEGVVPPSEHQQVKELLVAE